MRFPGGTNKDVSVDAAYENSFISLNVNQEHPVGSATLAANPSTLIQYSGIKCE
jgi:hypothetical protein